MSTKALCFSAITAIAALTSFADTATVDGITWTYTVSNGKASVGGPSKAIPASTSGSITIPATLGGKPVVNIADSAFYGCSGLTHVSICNSITNIGNYAFQNCTGLKSIAIPDGVTRIGWDAFMGCSELASVSIPDSVVNVCSRAFNDCNALLFDSASIDGVQLVDGWIVSAGNLMSTELDLAGCRGVAARVFQDCLTLTRVELPVTINGIGGLAFAGCANLESVIIGDGVKYIGDNAFQNCRALQSLVLGNGVEEILGGAFDGCEALKNVTVNQYVCDNSMGGIFPSSYQTITNIVLSDGVTKIGRAAFANCMELTNVEIPNYVTNIQMKIFMGCGNLESLKLPFVGSQRGNYQTTDAVFGWLFAESQASAEGASKIVQYYDEGHSRTTYIPPSLKRVEITDETIIAKGAFQNCSNIVSIVLGNTITNIAQYAFAGCGELVEMSIPQSVTEIGANVFRDCRNLRSADFPESVTYIGQSAFSGCESLERINLPQNVSSIEVGTFASCFNLADISVPPGVTNIGTSAFYANWSLSHIVIPSKVTSIGRCAFEHCTNLSGIVFMGNAPRSIGDSVFSDLDPNCKVYVPKYSSGWNVTIPGTWNGLHIEYFADLTYQPADRTIFDGSLSVAIAADKADAQIYYTLDGSEPTTNSIPYRKFRISEKTTVKAIAAIDGVVVSDVAVAHYALGACTDPVISLENGSVFQHSNQVVAIDWTETDGTLRYTLDGSEPTETSAEYTGPFTISETTTVKAKVFSDKFFDSNVVTATFTREWEKVATPVITVNATFAGTKTRVVMSCDSDGAIIRYTTDGNTPDNNSSVYSRAFFVTNSCTIKAYATLDDCTDSDVASVAIERVWGVGDSLGNSDLVFTNDCNAAWVRDTTVFKSGTDSMRSGSVGNEQTSELSTTVKGKGTFSFWWKTSCEESGGFYDWDHAEFHADGQVYYLDGETDWTQVVHEFTKEGVHELRWFYLKDNAGKDGSDCVWIDNLEWAGDPIPYLGDTPGDDEVDDALYGSADDNLYRHVTDGIKYKAYRAWADKVCGNNFIKRQTVKDSAISWLSFALDAEDLIASAPKQGDLTIAEFEPSATAGEFVLTFSLSGVSIGENATAENLAEVFGVEGTTELNEAAFSSEGLTINLQRTTDGKAKATVTPIGSPFSFFLRVKVK